MDNPPALRIQRPARLVRDEVTDVLRRAILDGVFAPGERLTEVKLLELTGVSRNSLREALRQLQTEGLLEPADSRGMRVTLLSPEELAELYQIREFLESAAVELFVLNASDAQVDALQQRLDDARDQPARTFDPWSNYYGLLFEGAGNELLRRLYGSIASRIVLMSRLALRSPGRSEISRRESDDVMAAIRARDVERAVTGTRHHVRSAKEAAIHALRSAADLRTGERA